MKQSTGKKSLALVESAVMIALATVLNLLSIVKMPYGGSITIASMLPIIIIGYRHGLPWGLGCGLVYGVIQQLLGLKNLSYFTTWQSIVAIIILDYVAAFAVCGLGGLFRRTAKNQAFGLTCGALLACLLRYLCHVISGATVWAGLSIPSQAALGYSLLYNATYMLPETIVTVVAAYYLASVIDFRAAVPSRISTPHRSDVSFRLSALAGFLLCGGLIYDVAAVFAHLQDPETGEFTLALLGEVSWIPVCAVSAVVLVAAVILFTIAGKKAASHAA